MHPELTRQARWWGVAGGGAWVAACRLRRRRPFAGLLWWASVWKMLEWHIGMAEGGDGVTRPRLSAADATTLSRFWLVPALPSAGPALPALVAAGGVTDWLDGTLARRSGRTRLGRDLDSTADLAFLTTAAVAARAAGRLPAIASAAIVARHAAGLGVAVGAVFGRARRPAIRARPLGGALRFGGLTLATAGLSRTGAAVLVAGCLVPPRSTAPGLSLA